MGKEDRGCQTKGLKPSSLIAGGGGHQKGSSKGGGINTMFGKITQRRCELERRRVATGYQVGGRGEGPGEVPLGLHWDRAIRGRFRGRH